MKLSPAEQQDVRPNASGQGQAVQHLLGAAEIILGQHHPTTTLLQDQFPAREAAAQQFSLVLSDVARKLYANAATPDMIQREMKEVRVQVLEFVSSMRGQLSAETQRVIDSK